MGRVLMETAVTTTKKLVCFSWFSFLFGVLFLVIFIKLYSQRCNFAILNRGLTVHCHYQEEQRKRSQVENMTKSATVYIRPL